MKKVYLQVSLPELNFFASLEYASSRLERRKHLRNDFPVANLLEAPSCFNCNVVSRIFQGKHHHFRLFQFSKIAQRLLDSNLVFAHQISSLLFDLGHLTFHKRSNLSINFAFENVKFLVGS